MKRKNLIGITLICLSLLFVGCLEKETSKPAEVKGEFIGLSATILYLQETNQIDSVNIELSRLIEIQTVINTKKNK